MTNPSDLPFETVALGASRGGYHALRTVLEGLSPFFPAPILIVQHLVDGRPSVLASLLQRSTKLRVKEAEPGEALMPGTVYTAPSGRHLEVTPDRTLALSLAQKECYARPSVDVLFRSVARAYGAKALGVVLTGYGRDGASGSRLLRAAGSRVLAQDETTSLVFEMPASAIATGCVDFVLPLPILARAITALVSVRGASDLLEVGTSPWATLEDPEPVA